MWLACFSAEAGLLTNVSDQNVLQLQWLLLRLEGWCWSLATAVPVQALVQTLVTRLSLMTIQSWIGHLLRQQVAAAGFDEYAAACRAKARHACRPCHQVAALYDQAYQYSSVTTSSDPLKTRHYMYKQPTRSTQTTGVILNDV